MRASLYLPDKVRESYGQHKKPNSIKISVKLEINFSPKKNPLRKEYRKGFGAQDRTRTYTAVRPLHPECSASTNSATWAYTKK